MTTQTLAPDRRSELDQLADEIRQHHRAVERAAQKMLDEAIAAGEGLLEAKAQLRHGEFGAFLRWCGVPDRSARVYMRLARNSGSAAVLEADSIRAALGALAGPSRKSKQLDLGPTAPPRSDRWRVEVWLAEMAKQGRDPAELRRHHFNMGHARQGLTEAAARRMYKKPYRCLVCGEWHGTGRA